MKNRFFISSFVGLLLFIFFPAQIFCENSQIKVSLAPEAGFLSGKIVENVWYVTSEQTETSTILTPTTRMSRLDWQEQNSFYWGFDSNFIINDSFSFLMSFQNAISDTCGVMEDYDWLNPITEKWKNDPADELTNYSIHTNYLSNYTHIRLLFGKIFYLDPKDNISLTPSFGIDIEHIHFSGIGGWKTYKSEKGIKKYFGEDEKVISYSQSYAAPIFSLNSDFNFTSFFETCLNLSVSWIKNLDCIDIHHAKNAYYNDKIENAWNLGAEVKLFFKINSHNKFGVKGGINYIPDAYGFTYNSKTDTIPDFSTLGGTSRLMWTYSFVYVFTF